MLREGRGKKREISKPSTIKKITLALALNGYAYNFKTSKGTKILTFKKMSFGIVID